MKKYISAIVTLIIFSCCNRESKPGVGLYNSDGGVYSFYDEHFIYELPNPENCIVASPENLPEDILMCVIDTLSNVSMLLVELPMEVTTEKSAKDALNLITRQEDIQKVTHRQHKLSSCVLMGNDALNYRVDLGIEVEQDTLEVSYYGYLFGNKAFVVTSQYADSLPDSFFNTYSYGLKRKNEK